MIKGLNLNPTTTYKNVGLMSRQVLPKSPPTLGSLVKATPKAAVVVLGASVIVPEAIATVLVRDRAESWADHTTVPCFKTLYTKLAEAPNGLDHLMQWLERRGNRKHT